MASAVASLNHSVSAAIRYFVSLQKLPQKALTTAWFLDQVFLWFSQMISRAIKTALSDFCPQKVYEAKVFLKNFKEMFSLLIILDKLSQGMWKPVQTGVLISTEAAFHLRNYFLNQQGFKYVFLSRFSQDILENLYSTTRRKTPNPRAREFRSAFRIIVLAQFFQPIRQGGVCCGRLRTPYGLSVQMHGPCRGSWRDPE